MFVLESHPPVLLIFIIASILLYNIIYETNQYVAKKKSMNNVFGKFRNFQKNSKLIIFTHTLFHASLQYTEHLPDNHFDILHKHLTQTNYDNALHKPLDP